MNLVPVLLRAAAGLALGLLFYGGLWITIRHLPAARHPAGLALASFWIRTLAVVCGFLWLMSRRWDYALVLLASFTLARLAVSRWLPERKAAECT